jgi:hypothetical protein
MDETRRSQQSSNFLARYWRGEYSLGFSYWVVGFLGNIAVVVATLLMASIVLGQDFNPYLAMSYVAAIWLVTGAWGVFQLVGVWRSAVRYRAEKAKQNRLGYWGVLAQLAAIFGALNLVAQFTSIGVPGLSESWDMAFRNDPRLPDYAIRVMRNGTELEIAGGFKYGLADDVEKIMSASPQVKVVHLNSVGGRIGEAERLSRLIRARNLATYSASQCLSACTIAFAAGRERWLLSGARLGYHRASFAGQEESETMRAALLQAGLDESFVNRAVSASSDEMWYPKPAELLAARAISAVVDSYRFAASGYGIRPREEDFKKVLRRSTLYRAIEEKEPRAFSEIAETFRRDYLDGMPEGQIKDVLRSTKLTPLLQARLPNADDETLAAFATLLADQYETLGTKDGKYCYDYAGNRMTTTLVDALGPELAKREIALDERIIRSSGSPTIVDKERLRSLYASVLEKLRAQYGESAIDVLTQARKIGPDQYGAYCRIATAMFREIARLPPADAGAIMSDIFKRSVADDKKN